MKSLVHRERNNETFQFRFRFETNAHQIWILRVKDEGKKEE